MLPAKFVFEYDICKDITDLDQEDAALLQSARKVTEHAYAPYSKFYVGATALLSNGKMVSGTNQENAAYPVGTCAERVLLGSAATLFPGIPIVAMAVSYQSKTEANDHPISPCGMCRQALLEFENRTATPIKIILSGQSGDVYIIKRASFLLPFAFTGEELPD